MTEEEAEGGRPHSVNGFRAKHNSSSSSSSPRRPPHSESKGDDEDGVGGLDFTATGGDAAKRRRPQQQRPIGPVNGATGRFLQGPELPGRRPRPERH